MSYALQIHPEADAEHAQTTAWLAEHVSTARALAYANAIGRALDEIRERPLAWPRWRSLSDVHVRHLPAISYSVIYRVQEDMVTILAFAHMHRALGYWLDRRP